MDCYVTLRDHTGHTDQKGFLPEIASTGTSKGLDVKKTHKKKQAKKAFII